MRKLIVTLVLLILLLVVPVGVTYASPAYDRVISAGETINEDVAVWGGSLNLEEGGTVDGDVSVFGGSAILNGHITGNVVVFGGNANVAGVVDGDLVLFGGTLNAAASADVAGDCVLLGGAMNGDGAGNLGCDAVGKFPEFMTSRTFSGASWIPGIPQLHISGGQSFISVVSSAAGQSLVFGILALVAAAVIPNHLGQVSRTLRRKPAASSAFGFLTLGAMVVAIVTLAAVSAILILVCIGLLGIPIVIALAVGLGAALILGWIATGSWLGERLATWLKLQNRSLVVTTALGTAVLTLASALFSSLDFWLGGWLWSLLAFLVACAGLGAVTLTRFGTRPYPAGAFEASRDKVAQMIDMMPDEKDLPHKPAA
jgi:hypothetical protein